MLDEQRPVFGDLNIMEGGSRVFARQGGRSYIALEWSWPDGERRETWGIRIEYTSVGADHTLDYLTPSVGLSACRKDVSLIGRLALRLEFMPMLLDVSYAFQDKLNHFIQGTRVEKFVVLLHR